MLTRRVISSNQRWTSGSQRRGAITVWMILAIPVLATLFCVVLEVGNLWLARIELTNALEASALAAVEEWGDRGGGDTLIPREVGRIFALSNTINGVPVNYDIVDPANPLNYNPAVINDNDSCDGTMIFGAIIEDDPEFVFDSCVVPSCLAGNVVLDATAQGGLQTGNNQEWGISFQPTNIPSDVRIVRVIYILPEECSYFNPPNSNNETMIEPRFDFTNSIPEVSDSVTDCDPNNILTDTCPSGNNVGTSSQGDVFGIDRNLVEFYIDVDPMNPIDLNCGLGTGTLVTTTDPSYISRIMAVEFPDGLDPLEGFDLEDRIRFGAEVTDNGSDQVEADDIGRCDVEVIVCFNNGTSVMGQFFDNDEPSNQCLQCVNVASWGMNTPLAGNCPDASTTLGNHGLIIHPNGTPDIPCPAASGNNNNGQSLAFVGAQGDARAFAVRAQATYEVPSICCQFCGIPIGPFFVSAKADALYDCSECVPRLYHIEEDNFHCAVDCLDE